MGRITGTRASGWGWGCRFGDPCGPRTAHPPPSGLGLQVPPVLLPKPRLAPGWGDPEGLWPGPGRPSGCRAAPHPMYLAARTTAGPAGQPPAPSSCGATTSAASAYQGLTGPLDLWEVGQRALPGASQGPGPPSSSLKQWTSHWPPGQALGQGWSFPTLTREAGEGKSLRRLVGCPAHPSGSAPALWPQPCSAGW